MNRTNDIVPNDFARRSAGFQPARSTFVDPGPKEARITILPPADLAPMLPTAQTAVELRTTYADRAKGFQIATFPVAVAFGLGALIVAVVGWAVPVISLMGVLVFWLAFLAWWLGGWLIHTLVSPDGIALLQAVLGYKYLRHEQKARLRRYTHGEGDR